MFPEEIEPKDGVLKACAKEGRDCGICVAKLPWLTDILDNERRGEEKSGIDRDGSRKLTVVTRKNLVTAGNNCNGDINDHGSVSLSNSNYPDHNLYGPYIQSLSYMKHRYGVNGR